MRRVIFLFLLSAWFFVCPSALAEGVNRALLIGCDTFVTMPSMAPAGSNNVSVMAQALSGGSMNLQTLITQRQGISGREALTELLQDAFADADAGDVSYLYISTHGLLDKEGNYHMVLSDGIHEELLSGSTLRRLLDRIPGKKVLLLDTCHAGAVIGKGMAVPGENLFAGEDYLVLCSSGGAEDSYLWSRPDGRMDGQSYFTNILCKGLSAGGGFEADENGDGNITCSELYRFVTQHYGESTPRMYPEESDFAFLRYSAEGFSRARITVPLNNICFERGVLSAASPEASFSFTVLRPVQMVYRVIYQRNGAWDFEHAEMYTDTSENQVAMLSPGWKTRTLTLRTDAADSGYALLQLISLEKGRKVRMEASTVLCVPPANEEIHAELYVPEVVAENGEVTCTILHDVPCSLTIQVEDLDGNLLRRLCWREATRPQQMGGTSFTWSGLSGEKQKIAPGTVKLRVQVCAEDQMVELLSDAIVLR